MTSKTPLDVLRELVNSIDEAEGVLVTQRPKELTEALDEGRKLVRKYEQDLLAKAAEAWGEAMKWFVYGCVAGGGQTDAHGAYASVGENGRLYCSFCHQPADERPKRRAVKEG